MLRLTRSIYNVILMSCLLAIVSCTTKPMSVDRFDWGPSAGGSAQQKGVYQEKILEGQGVNGVLFGDPKSKVLSLWGQPDEEKTNFDSIRGENVAQLHYENLGIIVHVSASKNTVCCSFLMNHKYRGKTNRGIQYGDDLPKVIDTYGKPDDEDPINWRYYARLGVKFYLTGSMGNQYVSLIEVLQPVSTTP